MYFQMIFKVFSENIDFEQMKNYSTIGLNKNTYSETIKNILIKFKN